MITLNQKLFLNHNQLSTNQFFLHVNDLIFRKINDLYVTLVFGTQCLVFLGKKSFCHTICDHTFSPLVNPFHEERTLWHFNSMFGSSQSASSAYQRFKNLFSWAAHVLLCSEGIFLQVLETKLVL